MNVGYARVSTGEQKMDLQLDALKEAGCEKVFTDKLSGATADRPGLEEAVDYARPDDTLVVWRLDRFGRSLKDLVTKVERLGEKEVGFRRCKRSCGSRTSRRGRSASGLTSPRRRSTATSGQTASGGDAKLHRVVEPSAGR
jgi:DNA invertase Pin-like site-specific DNA recombinase